MVEPGSARAYDARVGSWVNRDRGDDNDLDDTSRIILMAAHHRDAGALYLVRRDQARAADLARDAMVRTCPRGATHVAVAVELWTIAGWPERAHQIEAIVERVVEQEGNLASSRSIAELLDLLAGLDDALRDSITDADLRVAPIALPLLRAHTRLIDVFDHGAHAAIEGVREAVAEVRELQHALEDALAGGLGVRFG